MKIVAHLRRSFREALCVAFVALASCSTSAAESQSRSAPRALDVQTLEPAEYHMLSHRKLLFATSRKVAQSAESAARSKPGGSVRYENVFLEALSPSIAYGWVEVGYPSDREFGAQNYSPDPSNPNPFSYFSIEAYSVVGTRQAAQELAKNQGFPLDERAIVFVHGINNSFSDAAERLTQLVVDLNVKGTPLLFSWPSETGVPVVRVSPERYRNVLSNATTSEPYLAQAVEDVLSSQQDRFDLLAHSMGTLVAFDALRLQSPKNVGTLDPSAPPPSTLPNVVLAAPDIGMKHFAAGREEFIRKARRLTVYCGRDRALFFSKQVNGDERLGYCGDPKQQNDYIEGVEFVRVYGNYRDPFSHSYYINSPPILNDMKQAISMEQGASAFPGSVRQPYREIFLNY